MDHAIGIDIGTSAVKLALVDGTEQVVAVAEAPLTTERPRAGWSEQDPAQWWEAVAGLMDRLAAGHPGAMGRVGALGLSGQSHAAVLLDAAHAPLRPAILWNDARASAEAADLGSRFPDLARVVGVLPMASFPAAKMLWLARHEPEVVERLHTFLLPKDYVRLKLSGEVATDMSDAAGTWWLDEARRSWCEPALAASGMPRSALPRLVEGTEPAGTLRRELAERWGLPPGAIVAGGGGDAAAGAVGIGAVNDGQAFLQIGTSAQLFVTTNAYRPAPETAVHAFAHALPGRWYQMGAMLNGASCLAFAAQLFSREVGELLAELPDVKHPSPILFLPYLVGERTPHNDPHARGVFFGLSPDTPRRDVVQAVLEGVAFSFADCRDALAASGTPIRAAGVTGGGARSALWMRILASVLGIPLTRYRGGDKGPAFGAARLARLAVGLGTPAQCGPPEILDITEPDPALAEAYAVRLARFRRLYDAVRPVFAENGKGQAQPATRAAGA